MNGCRGARIAGVLTAGLVAAFVAGPVRAQSVGSDYPTAERADYVFGCMAANGQTRESLEKCSCSIDTISTLLPYSEYEEAETVLRMNKIAGQSSELFRSSGDLKDKVSNLRRAQAEAEIKCFY